MQRPSGLLLVVGHFSPGLFFNKLLPPHLLVLSRTFTTLFSSCRKTARSITISVASKVSKVSVTPTHCLNAPGEQYSSKKTRVAPSLYRSLSAMLQAVNQ